MESCGKSYWSKRRRVLKNVTKYLAEANGGNGETSTVALPVCAEVKSVLVLVYSQMVQCRLLVVYGLMKLLRTATQLESSEL
jgi:hypothetical protein